MKKYLNKANDNLINMVQTAMTDREKTTMLTRAIAGFTKRFGSIEEKLDRMLAVQTGLGASASNPTTKKYVMGQTYWKSDGKQIYD